MNHASRFLLLAPVILFSACGSSEKSGVKNQPPPPRVEGLVLKTGVFDESIRVTGTVIASEETALMPEVSGRVTQLNLPEGQKVSKGTLLVKLNDAELQAQRKRIDAELKSAVNTGERQEKLLSSNGISREEYDQTQTRITTLQADLAAVDAQIAKTEIRAPFDGTIGLRKVSEGAYVSPGTTLAVIRTEDNLKIDFNVPESSTNAVHTGMQVSFTTTGDSATYTATVIATEQQVESGSLNLQVRARVDQKNIRLLPGASAEVQLDLKSSSSAIVVPTQAVIPQARYKVVIVSRKGLAEFVKIQTGVRRPSDVEVLSGLAAGDTIVTTGTLFLKPGMPVKFSKVK